jgi:hypothetical protein
MVHMSKVMRGLANFIDAEIVSKMKGSVKGWIVGGVSGLAISRAERIIETVRDNQIIKAFGIIDGEEIDIESIYAEIRKQAEKGNATLEIPFIGSITLGLTDVDRLYRMIKEA